MYRVRAFRRSSGNRPDAGSDRARRWPTLCRLWVAQPRACGVLCVLRSPAQRIDCSACFACAGADDSAASVRRRNVQKLSPKQFVVAQLASPRYFLYWPRDPCSFRVVVARHYGVARNRFVDRQRAKRADLGRSPIGAMDVRHRNYCPLQLVVARYVHSRRPERDPRRYRPAWAARVVKR